METVLESLAALLIVASAILLMAAGAFYFLPELRTGAEVTLQAGSPGTPEFVKAANNLRTPDNSDKSGSPTSSQQSMSTDSQSPLTSETRRSGNAPPPPGDNTTAATPPTATATAPATRTSAAVTSTTDKAAVSSRPFASEQQTDGNNADLATGPQKTPIQASTSDHAAASSAVTPNNDNVLILIRGPGKIRSEPGRQGRVIGTVPKNAIVKPLDRAGNWVRIETEAGTGWVHTALLGRPESR
jgi:hypothetical protein